MKKKLKPAAELAELRVRPLPGESAKYTSARKQLLAAEIEARRKLTRLAEQRQALPKGPVVEKNYRFKDANGVDVGLANLFGRHSTLITYFWMYGPDRARPCPMCTNFLGGANGNAADVKQRAAFKILGRSTVERQKAFAMEAGTTSTSSSHWATNTRKTMAFSMMTVASIRALLFSKRRMTRFVTSMSPKCRRRQPIPARIPGLPSTLRPSGISWI
jgi:predicted dithiol-disulfide oxidoreductase (DUF899 family)